MANGKPKKAEKKVWIRTTGLWYEDGVAHPIGTEVERDESVARAVIQNGSAIEIDAPPPPEGAKA